MTAVSLINISKIRNITEEILSPGSHVNLVYGDNGSGKTSILEAIYLAAIGRSFRGSKINPLIQYNADNATVYVELRGGNTIGLQKSRKERPLLKFNGSIQTNWLEIARAMPVQVIEPNTFRLLEGGPKERRRFLDWGVFHVEPSFSEHWRNARKCIEHRNLLLKSPQPDTNLIRAWSTELARESRLVDKARSAYFDTFMPIFGNVLQEIANIRDISIEYNRGWPKGGDLLEELQKSEPSDVRSGFTQRGPHRADIVVRSGSDIAIDVLSRGQQKMVVSALKLAQGKLQAQTSNNRCIFLVDDLAAELDSDNRARVCEYLTSLDTQVFITCVDLEALKNSFISDKLVPKFHVKHGKIEA